jgi:gas vesicle structural protein
VPEPFVSLSAPSDNEVSLLELADRLLNRGVVITGEAVISVAGVDLIYLGLNVVLTAVENLPYAEGRDVPTASRDLLDDL